MGRRSERKLGNHVEGDLLKPSVKVVSNSVVKGWRTVVLTRGLAGAGADYYTFSVTSTDATVPFITAVGSTPQLSYHRAKAVSNVALLPIDGTVPLSRHFLFSYHIFLPHFRLYEVV